MSNRDCDGTDMPEAGRYLTTRPVLPWSPALPSSLQHPNRFLQSLPAFSRLSFWHRLRLTGRRLVTKAPLNSPSFGVDTTASG